MPRKSKVAQSLRSTRGLGYLPVILLVASALIVGAGHEPLQHWLGSFFQADSNVGAVTSNDGNVSVSETRDLDSPQQIESLVASEIDLTILKVTVADSTRIEYLIVPEAMQIDWIHRRAVYGIICALQKGGPARGPFIFVGVGRFIDAAGQPTIRSRVESKLSALWMNRMDCAPENSERDIDWKRVSKYHIKFAVPRGFKQEF